MIFRLLVLVLSISLSDYLGGYAGSGFRYSTNARDMSLGNSLISEYNQGFNSFSNPALLSHISDLEFGMSFFPMSLDRSIQTFSVSRSLSRNAGASLSIFRSGISDIQGKDSYNNATGSFGSSEGYVMISFGTKLGRHDILSETPVEESFYSISKLAVGLNIKAIFNNIDKYSATGVAGDIGILYNMSDKITLSATLNNVFGEYSWEGLESGSASSEESLPTFNSLGFKYNLSSFFEKLPISDVMLFSKIDYMKINNLNLSRLQSGLEIGYSNYDFRLGVIQNKGLDKFDIKVLMGIGLENESYKFDYCIDFGREHEGISNLFSISFIR